MANGRQSTRQQLKRVPGVNCLYRHQHNGNYYGVKKLQGKRKEHSLHTKDRKIAERTLKEWLSNLEKIDTNAQKTTFRQLIEKFQLARQGKAPKTIATDSAIITKLRETWDHGLEMRVSELRPSHLNEWLAKHEARLKHTTYNRYANLLKQMFEIAVADRMIGASPFDGVTSKWKKPQKPIRHVPTQEQFGQIVASIREQKFSNDADTSKVFRSARPTMVISRLIKRQSG